MKLTVKSTLLTISIIFFLASCDLWEQVSGESKEKFIHTYKDIIIIREQYPDTLEANPKVDSLLNEKGYTQESFKEEYFNFAKDSREFIKMIDSARTLAKIELSELQQKEEEAKRKAAEKTAKAKESLTTE